jgi:SAM-dependent methyltransferase
VPGRAATYAARVTYHIDIRDVPPGVFAAVRKRVAWSEVPVEIRAQLDIVWAWLRTVRDQVTPRHNVVVYRESSATGVEIECGVEVTAPFDRAPAPIRCSRLPWGRAAHTVHVGPYHQLGGAHDAVTAACREQGHDDGIRWEVYGDWNEDPALLETDVYRSVDPNGAQLEYWNGIAGDRWASMWQLLDRVETAITRAVLALAAARPGERVLDVGCGAASTTLALREQVGDGGAVLGVDISGPMLEVARTRARDAGARITFVEADAATYALAPEHDLVFSRFGVMFFAAPEAAFANLRRGLAPGGRLAFCCWCAPSDNAWITAPLAAARDLLPADFALPPVGTPGPFAFADPDRLRSLLEASGWRDISIARHDHHMWLGATPEDAARGSLLIGPIARSVATLSDETRIAILERLAPALAAFATPTGISIPAASWLVTAR